MADLAETFVVVAYARVSSAGQNLAGQVVDLKTAVAQNGWILKKIYVETASGADSSRFEYNLMIEELPETEPDAVIVTFFDRTGRDDDELRRFVRDLFSRGIEIIETETMTRISESDSPDDEFKWKLKALLADYQRKLIRQKADRRFREKLARQRAGELAPGERRIGRPKRKLTRKERRTVSLMLSAKTGISAIARHLNVSRSTCYALLDREGLLEKEESE